MMQRQELTCHGSCLTPGPTRFETHMNLSHYLQMPPAPSVSKSPTSSPVQGPTAGVSTASNNGLGLDFAQLMAKQFQQLSATQRQDLAATTHQASQQVDEHAFAQPQDNASNKNANLADATSADRRETQAHDNNNDASSNTTPTRTRARTATKPIEDTPPAWMAQHTTQRTAAQPEDPASTSASSAATDNHGLRTIELSPQVRIITDPGKAPSPESLTAFAKAMGLDEAAIQKLMGSPETTTPTQAAVDTNALAPSATSITSQAGSPNALLAALQAHTEGRGQFAFQATSAMGPPPMTASLGDTNLNVPLGHALTDAAAAATLNALSGTAANGALQPMTAAEMAAIQQIQITVLPAAVLPVGTSNSASAPSTLEMLSLLGGTAQESDISALASAFAQGEAGENGNPSQGQSSDNGNTSGFAQTLARQSTTNNAALTTSTQATSSTHMSEVYDQLSDKLATEMAARMHKQLSDGEWKMKFGLRPANLGGVEIQLEMKDGKLDAVFRADNPLTRDLLQNSSQRLRDALENFGIQAGQVQIGHQADQQQQNPSHGSAKQPQVGDNSPLQVNASNDSTPVTARNKANASLLDLYA